LISIWLTRIGRIESAGAIRLHGADSIDRMQRSGLGVKGVKEEPRKARKHTEMEIK